MSAHIQKTPVVRKTQMECYRINANGEWATICISAGITKDLGGKVDRHYGEILIYSTFGAFANHWSHCGEPFKKMLIDLEFGYFMGKTRGNEAREFDPEASYKRVKEGIIELRFDGTVDKDGARRLWTRVEDLAHATNSHEFMETIHAAAEMEPEVENSRYLTNDAYEYIHQR